MQTETLENPVLKDDPMDAIMEAADAADRGLDFKLPSAEQSDTHADTTETQTSNPDIKPDETKTDERPRDELGRFTKTADGTDIPETDRQPAEPVPSGEKPGDTETADDAADKPTDSAYERARKDRERLDRNRREFEEEKARAREENATERRRIEAERAELERARNPQSQNGDYRPRYSPEQYADLAKESARKAKELRNAGDYEGADEQSDIAARAAEAVLVSAEYHQAEAAKHYQTLWEQEMVKCMSEDAELRTPGSAVSTEIQKLLDRNNPLAEIFERNPQGFRAAAQFAKQAVKAGLVSGLEQENKKLKAEVEQFRQKTGLGRGGPTPRVPEKSFDSMNLDEQERAIMRAAEAHDAATTNY